MCHVIWGGRQACHLPFTPMLCLEVSDVVTNERRGSYGEAMY